MRGKTSYENLELERRGATLRVRLDRPERLNAFNPGMIDDLCSLCRELRRDLATRFVVFTGSGRAFSSPLAGGRSQSYGIWWDHAPLPDESNSSISLSQNS